MRDGARGSNVGHCEQPAMTEVGAKLRALRHARGWSIEATEQIAGIGAMLSHYERGRRMPSLQNVAKLCETFKISLSRFFDGVKTEEILDSTHSRGKVS